jgi:hypothetical protein
MERTSQVQGPVPTLNASRISSSESVSCIFLAMRVMNSAKSIELFPSASTWAREAMSAEHVQREATRLIDSGYTPRCSRVDSPR